MALSPPQDVQQRCRPGVMGWLRRKAAAALAPFISESGSLSYSHFIIIGPQEPLMHGPLIATLAVIATLSSCVQPQPHAPAAAPTSEASPTAVVPPAPPRQRRRALSRRTRAKARHPLRRHRLKRPRGMHRRTRRPRAAVRRTLRRHRPKDRRHLRSRRSPPLRQRNPSLADAGSGRARAAPARHPRDWRVHQALSQESGQ